MRGSCSVLVALVTGKIANAITTNSAIINSAVVDPKTLLNNARAHGKRFRSHRHGRAR